MKFALHEQMNMSMHDECMSLLVDQHHNSFVNGLVQHKLNLTLQEYRGMHKQSSRGQLPHNKLIYPETLRYLSLWVLGDATSFLSLQVNKKLCKNTYFHICIAHIIPGVG